MNTNILFNLEKVAYPAGTILAEGENLRTFATNESGYVPPVRLPDNSAPLFPIIVPTKRHILKNRKNIKRIMQLAAERDNSLLILLCSSPAKKEDVQALAINFPGLRWMAVDGPFSYDHGPYDFETTSLLVSQGRYRDTPQKRNFALQLARAMGWETVFFLDDDITMTSAQLNKACRLLESRDVSIVGFNARRFPDNSVAVHAHRWLYDSIDSFIGAGAMAVKTNSPLVSFFPHIYNEDWLFLLIYRLLGEGNIIWAGSIAQRRYNPYKNIRRAITEEVGDILGESLSKLVLVLCESGRKFKNIGEVTAKFRELANEDFWDMEINNRLDYLNGLQEGLRGSKKTNLVRRHQAKRALNHAIATILGNKGRGGVTGKQLAEWTAAWCRDIERWNTVPTPKVPHETITDAFAALDFTNDFIYQANPNWRERTAPTRKSISSRTVTKKASFKYTGYTVMPRDQATLKSLWLTKTVQDYLAAKELRMDKIVTSADMLRYDRPTHWLTTLKPLSTVSMIIAHGESIAQIRSVAQNIIKWTKGKGPVQLIIWVYGDPSVKHQLDIYRNKIVAQLMHDIVGTHIHMRSSIIASKNEEINHIIDTTLDDISFAYWRQMIPADNQIFVTNSHGELLRLGTFCQFMNQEHLLPRHSLKYSLQKFTAKATVSEEISKESDAVALHEARARLVQPGRKYHLPHPIASSATSHMVQRMEKARLTWVQLDDLAYNVTFHNPAGEDSVEHIKRMVCVPVSYRKSLPSNIQTIAQELAQKLTHYPGDATSYMLVIQGQPDDSWSEIEHYRAHLMKTIVAHVDKNTLLVSANYRLSPGESDRLFKYRIQALGEYLHWLQNHANPIRIEWRTYVFRNKEDALR